MAAFSANSDSANFEEIWWTFRKKRDENHKHLGDSSWKVIQKITKFKLIKSMDKIWDFAAVCTDDHALAPKRVRVSYSIPLPLR